MVNPEKYTGDNGSYDYYDPGPGGYIYIYLGPVCPLFWWLNPPKQGLFQSKHGSFGFQVYIYILTLTLIDPIQTINYSCIAVKVSIPFSLM